MAGGIVSGRYRHYKGGEYEVIGVARHSETEEAVVVYRCLYGDYSLWVRPLTMFLDTVTVGGVAVSRFVSCSGDRQGSDGVVAEQLLPVLE